MSVCAIGLWHRYFLVMFQGQTTPAEPTKPPEVHIRDGVEVPYTSVEIRERTAIYAAKKTIWDKTMKVPSTIITRFIIVNHYITCYCSYNGLTTCETLRNACRI